MWEAEQSTERGDLAEAGGSAQAANPVAPIIPVDLKSHPGYGRVIMARDWVKRSVLTATAFGAGAFTLSSPAFGFFPPVVNADGKVSVSKPPVVLPSPPVVIPPVSPQVTPPVTPP